jgi:hypothetical protein
VGCGQSKKAIRMLTVTERFDSALYARINPRKTRRKPVSIVTYPYLRPRPRTPRRTPPMLSEKSMPDLSPEADFL